LKNANCNCPMQRRRDRREQRVQEEIKSEGHKWCLFFKGEIAVYSIEDGSVLAGSLPPQKHKLVVAWIEIHKEDLMADWELAVNGQNPLPIRGLDQ
jgi:hypothetical protein